MVGGMVAEEDMVGGRVVRGRVEGTVADRAVEDMVVGDMVAGDTDRHNYHNLFLSPRQIRFLTQMNPLHSAPPVLQHYLQIRACGRLPRWTFLV